MTSPSIHGAGRYKIDAIVGIGIGKMAVKLRDRICEFDLGNAGFSLALCSVDLDDRRDANLGNTVANTVFVKFPASKRAFDLEMRSSLECGGKAGELLAPDYAAMGFRMRLPFAGAVFPGFFRSEIEDCVGAPIAGCPAFGVVRQIAHQGDPIRVHRNCQYNPATKHK